MTEIGKLIIEAGEYDCKVPITLDGIQVARRFLDLIQQIIVAQESTLKEENCHD